MHCSRCLALRTGCFNDRPACAKCMSLATGDYTHDYLARQFSVRELRRFLAGRCVAIDGCSEKHDLIELMMQLRRSSLVQAENEERSRHVSQLRVTHLTDLYSTYSTIVYFKTVAERLKTMQWSAH